MEYNFVIQSQAQHENKQTEEERRRRKKKKNPKTNGWEIKQGESQFLTLFGC